MATDDGKPTATVLRIKVRHGDIETFVERFANQVTRAGVFIPTRSPKPIGTEVRFEIRLSDDRPVLVGQGQVRLVRQHDAARPRVVAGMAVELQRVGRDSRDVLLKMLEVRRRRGFVDGPGGMPLPGDEPNEDTTATETTAIRPVPTAPHAVAVAVPEAVSVPGSVSVSVPESVPVSVPVSVPGSVPESVSGSVAGSIAEALSARLALDAVADEPPAPPPPPPPDAPVALAPAARRQRPQLDLSAIAAAAPDNDVLDDDLQSWAEAQVPLEQVVARARALAGADLDGELAAIVAAPMPVIDRETARAAVAALAGPERPRRAKRERLAPLSIAPPSDDARTDDATTPVPAPLPTAPLPTAPTRIFDEAATSIDHERAAAEEAERHNARTRAAERATRERARREANDRALLERNERVRRETAERDRVRLERAASSPPPVMDPFADLDLDEPTPKPPVRPAARRPPEDTTRKVDAAALAAEALDAGALRASLTEGGDPDLGFLDALHLDEPGRNRARPARAAAHTVPRAAAPRPAAVIPPAAAPRPTAAPRPAAAAPRPAATAPAAAPRPANAGPATPRTATPAPSPTPRPAAAVPPATARPAAAPRPAAAAVPRAPSPAPQQPAAARKPPGPTRPVPVPAEAVDVDLDDDAEIEISISIDPDES